MNLIIPGVGTEAGPTYATDINNSLTIIDQHDHTAGKGVQLTQASLNINGAFPLNNNPLLTIQYVKFTLQTTAPTASTAPNSLYVDSSGNLHYINTTADIQVTSGNALNVTSSGISSGTATASFISSVLTVYANSSNSTPANISGASLLLGNNTSNSKYLTLSPPSAMAANYTLVLPSIGASQGVLTLDTSGNITAAIPDSTLAVTGSTIGVAAAGITTTQIATGSVTRAQQAAMNYAVVSNLTGTTGSSPKQLGTISITTTGIRPVRVFATGTNDSVASFGDGNSPIIVNISNTSTGQNVTVSAGAANGCFPHVELFDTSVVGSPGTYTYSLTIQSQNGPTIGASGIQLVGYEY